MRVYSSFYSLLPVALLALFTASCSQPPAAPPPPPYQAVATTKELMQAAIDPAADEIWDSVGTVMTKEGTFEKFPTTDDEWAHVRNNAIVLAESGNLLMMGSRSGGSDEWMKIAQNLVAQSKFAIAAVDAKDKEKLFTVGGDIYDACTACHSKFMTAITEAGRR